MMDSQEGVGLPCFQPLKHLQLTAADFKFCKVTFFYCTAIARDLCLSMARLAHQPLTKALNQSPL